MVNEARHSIAKLEAPYLKISTQLENNIRKRFREEEHHNSS